MNPTRIFSLAALSTVFLCASGRGTQFHSDDPSWDDMLVRKRIVRLSGDWKFSVGDNAEWAAPGFVDHEWETIHAPAEWQSEGYRGYNGYAWYRKTFDFPRGHDKETVYLSLGKVDDVDQVYLNGKLVGSTGQFQPAYVSAYDKPRVYEVPAGWLLSGKDNVLAVRVYDGGGVGGIVNGPLGLFALRNLKPEVSLGGRWLFHPGDNPDWKQEHCDETGFAEIQVPSYWEDAGYPQLDGYVWYRRTFALANPPAEKTLVLMLGKIDDFDEVYINGTFVGSTGPVERPEKDDGVAYYAQNRGYVFPASLLKETNTIAVRVYDRGGRGGIYAGPVAIISQPDYIRYWETRRKESHGLGYLVRLLTDAIDDED